jgi:hypothetical protein
MESNNSKKLEITGTPAYPNPSDSFEVKKTNAWGLAFARAIESEWFYRYGGAPCAFYTQREQFRERRAYAKGLQSTKKYIDTLTVNGDLSYVNLTGIRPITIMPKLVDVVVNGMMSRDYSVRAYSVDPISQEERETYRKEVEKDRITKDISIKAKETLGIDVSFLPIDQVPETDEELQLHMDLEYKPSIELSEELAIQTVFEENEYNDTVRKRVITDLVVCGFGCEKDEFIPGQGIKVRYVDAENKIHPYTDDPFYKTNYYDGEVKEVLISDLITQYPWLYDSPETQELMETSGQQWWTYHGFNINERMKGTTQILYFTCVTTRKVAQKIKEKSTGMKVVSKADEVFDETAVENVDFKRLEKVEEVLMEGVYVLGTDILLKWDVAENMSRPKSNSQKVIRPYRMVAPNKERGYIDSLVARMIPIDDIIQVSVLKGLQILQKVRPDGFQIDVDGLVELDLGDGKTTTIQDNLNMFVQGGDILTRSSTAGGDFNYAKDIVKELRTGDSLNKLQAIENTIAINTDKMRDVIGLNRMSDASTPDKDSLVGLQKMAALNSNTATRHILDASNYLTKNTAQAISYRIADVLKYSNLKEDLARKIGKTAVLDLESVKNLHLYDFAIYFELALDEEERAKLEIDLTKEIDKGYITTEMKFQILNIKNMRLATQYLGILRKKFAKKQEEQKKREYDYQSEANIRSAQEAEKARQQTIAMELDAKIQVQQMISQGEIAKEQVRGQQDRETLEMKIQGDLQITSMQTGAQIQKQTEAEDRKDKRTQLQATQQSELIAQRQRDEDPKNFEEPEELDIFTLNP